MVIPSKPEHLRVLLTGATGQVGGDLLPMLQAQAEVAAPTRDELDLSSSDSIRRFIRDFQPHWIINPAAYTAVDKAEIEPELAHAINADAPRVLGEEAAIHETCVIHFSTDYVFDGSGRSPWHETDSPAPLGVYGATKLAGERNLAATGASHLIFRTSWVYGTRGKNFLRTILRMAGECDELRIVDDQFGAPTWSNDLARMTTDVILQIEHEAAVSRRPRVEILADTGGLYHAASSGVTTWFGFAQEFLRLAAAIEPGRKWASLSPISTADYPTPAKRPRNSRLDCSRLAEAFGRELPAWKGSTKLVVAQLFEADHKAAKLL